MAKEKTVKAAKAAKAEKVEKEIIEEVVVKAPKAAPKKTVVTTEELFRERKGQDVEIGGVHFIVTKAEGCKVELERKDYK